MNQPTTFLNQTFEHFYLGILMTAIYVISAPLLVDWGYPGFGALLFVEFFVLRCSGWVSRFWPPIQAPGPSRADALHGGAAGGQVVPYDGAGQQQETGYWGEDGQWAEHERPARAPTVAADGSLERVLSVHCRSAALERCDQRHTKILSSSRRR